MHHTDHKQRMMDQKSGEEMDRATAKRDKQIGLNFTRLDIEAMATMDLRAIVRSTNPNTSRFADEMAWARTELRRRVRWP